MYGLPYMARRAMNCFAGLRTSGLRRLAGAAANLVAITLIYLVSSAHVGSPDTWFEGMAGPYPVTVQIVPAGVVPGVANVFVRITGDQPSLVTVQANRFDATGGAPPPESAPAVEGDAGLFAGKLWIMSGGSNSVSVDVTGPKGRGKVVVPLVASATRRLEMNVPMGIGLATVGMFLLVGLVTIIGAAVRESTLTPGETAGPSHFRRARRAMLATTVVAGGLLFGGWTWWNAEDAGYVSGMFKPFAARTSVAANSGVTMLTVAIADSAWMMRGDSGWLSRHGASSWTPLVKDHGKLMHLFLVREDLSAFAHLHPASADSVQFTSQLPPLPVGNYRVFGDIVHESGFTQTVVSSVTVAGAAAPQASMPNDDGDDSWFVGEVNSNATSIQLANGGSMTWNRGPQKLVSGVPARLQFTITNRDGTAAVLEPYMGMPAHAVVARDDGSVFVHLHPSGTISMASQMAFAMRQPGDSVRGRLGRRITEAGEMPMAGHGSTTSNIVSFPYAFPKPGQYRVWVQVRQAGEVFTGAFHASVTDGAESAR